MICCSVMCLTFSSTAAIPGISDHQAISAALLLRWRRRPVSSCRKNCLYNKANSAAISADLSSFLSIFNHRAGISDVNATWDHFKSKLFELFDRHILIRIIRTGEKFCKTWMDHNLLKVINRRERALKRHKENKTAANKYKCEEI